MASRAAEMALDRSRFEERLDLVALRVSALKTSAFMKRLSKQLLNVARVRNVERDGDDASKRLILLSKQITDLSLDALPEPLREWALSEGAEPVRHTIVLDYAWFSAEQVLRQLLPVDVETPSAFETAGHVAHLNLRESQLPYKAAIGAVILDKNAHIRTVVNKVGTIETEYRTFPMELLAGDDDLEVELRESGALFRFNFAEVYWNSRLQAEHKRLVDLIAERDATALTVWDVFAGIGPFAVPLALKGATVYANDLNPRSFEALVANARLNKCERCLHASNEDGRAFLRRARAAGPPSPTHIVMNLPKIGIEFLDALREFPAAHGRPLVHVYCFSKAEDYRADVLARVGRALDAKLDAADIHVVRDVAPRTPMLCVSFRLPAACLASDDRGATPADGDAPLPPAKKPRPDLASSGDA